MKRILFVFALAMLILGPVVNAQAVTEADKATFKTIGKSLFNHLIQKKFAEAKALFASKAAVTEAELQGYAQHYGFTAVEDGSSFSTATSGVFVEAASFLKVKTSSGKAKDPKFAFYKEGGAWKIAFVLFESLNQTHMVMVQEGPKAFVGGLDLPSRDQMNKLVIDIIHDMGTDINNWKSEKFYNRISRAFKATYTPEKMIEVFRGFKNAKIDLTVVKGHTPKYKHIPARIMPNQLKVVGKVPLASLNKKVPFDFIFVFEEGSWKVNKFNVNYN